MRLHSPPGFIQSLFSVATWKRTTDKKVIYLTFDDGPTPIITRKILDILQCWNAKATFFCLGKQVENHPDIFAQIITEGHAIGNHTYSHLNAWKTPGKIYLNDIDKCGMVFRSTLFRPPYGCLPLSHLSEIRKKYKIIMWSLMSYDFDPELSPGKISRIFLKRGAPGQIWLFHDNEISSLNCLKVLPELLQKFTDRGYSFHKL